MRREDRDIAPQGRSGSSRRGAGRDHRAGARACCSLL